mmetsp:Transcript_50474/g.130301  ORF Transcript_50474/g.130301 Transcript_50474/m.130301 type:complete len:213 (+) Transcript_50474:997-1635(+)
MWRSTRCRRCRTCRIRHGGGSTTSQASGRSQQRFGSASLSAGILPRLPPAPTCCRARRLAMPEEQATWRTRRRTTTTRTRSSAMGAALCAGICTRWLALCSRTLLRSARRWGRAATSTLAAWSSSSSWWRIWRSCRRRPRTWVSSRCPAPPPTARGPATSSCSPTKGLRGAAPRAAAPLAAIGPRRVRRAEAGRPWRPPECRRWPARAAQAV